MRVQLMYLFLATSLLSCEARPGDAEEHGARTDQDEHSEHDEAQEGVVKLSADAVKRSKISVAEVESRKVPRMIHTTARVDFDETKVAHVGPRIPGRVASVAANLGDTVKSGDTLAVLDSVVLGETIARQRATVVDEELARKTLNRERTLHAEKLSPEQQVLEAEAAYQKALAMRREATEQLRLYGGKGSQGSHFRLRAPIDGRVIEKHLTLGELVTPEDKVFTVADLSSVWIWVDLFERDLSRVHIGDDATAVTDAWPTATFSGKVAYITDTVDPDSRTVRARVDIDNPDGKLKPGMFANVTLSDPHDVNQQPLTEVLAIPPSAIQREGNGWVAFVQTEPGHFEKRFLQVGIRTDAFIEVIQGVAEGEDVVIEGGFILKSEAAKEEMGGHGH